MADLMWEERCLAGQNACDWWLRGHEDKAHAIVADGSEVDKSGMVSNYPSYVVGIIVRLFNDTRPGDTLRVLEGFCPWHSDRLDQGRCFAYSGNAALSWLAGTDGAVTEIAGSWTDGVDYVSRRWVFNPAEIRAASQ